ncbi:transposase [Flavobacterium sp.]|uniref:REP-associated tyrosine transposase n=1 Tax=Flavobacterium sp. TaxID=239 RepID=UPI00122360F8|nr:transposase [Flavobacterium sp.]RZJ73896.1 MAG: transposase [Flavobacterium sp.]
MEVTIRNQKGIHLLTMKVVDGVGVFDHKSYRDLFLESIRYCQENKGMDVFAYVIMPDHVHMIIQSRIGLLSDLLRDFKKFTSKKIVASMIATNDYRLDWMLKRFEFAVRRHTRNERYQFWENGNNPREIDTVHEMNEAIEFVHQNPVRAGFVESAEAYLYSSARNFSNQSALVEIIYT